MFIGTVKCYEKFIAIACYASLFTLCKVIRFLFFRSPKVDETKRSYGLKKTPTYYCLISYLASVLSGFYMVLNCVTMFPKVCFPRKEKCICTFMCM